MELTGLFPEFAGEAIRADFEKASRMYAHNLFGRCIDRRYWDVEKRVVCKGAYTISAKLMNIYSRILSHNADITGLYERE